MCVDPDALAAASSDAAAVFFQQPNFLGCLEDAPALAAAANEAGALSDRPRRPDVARCTRGPGRVRLRDRARGRAVAGNWPSTAAPLRLFRSATTRAAVAGTDRRRDRRRPRTRRIRPHAPDARAAHPPREGDLEHHHEPDAARARGTRDPLVAGRRGCARWGRRASRSRTTRARAFRSSQRSTALLQGGRVPDADPGAGHVRRIASTACTPATCSAATTRGWTTSSSSRSPRSALRRRRRSACRRLSRCADDRAGSAWPDTPLIFERSRAGRRAGRPPRPDLPVPELPTVAPRARAAPARARRARARSPFHGARRPHVRRRHRLLPARLLHDEAQPAGATSAWPASRLPRPPPARRRTRARRARSSSCGTCRRSSPRSRGFPP